MGVGVLAYTFGLRHAFDADHIAAVDNTTRKLLADNADRGRGPGRKPLSVGFWFSLGHSTIVFALAFLLSVGVKALAGQVENDDSEPALGHRHHRCVGLRRLPVDPGHPQPGRPDRHHRGLPRDAHRHYDEAELEDQLNKRGFMNRFLGGLTKSVRKPWHIYPIGVLFGLGFDTATEVGLLVLAGGAAAFNLPFYAILVLPILFAAGMCLMDTVDGVFMNAAYGWAFAKPVRKVFYNITITTDLGRRGPDHRHDRTDRSPGRPGPHHHRADPAIASIPLDYAGYAIVGLFFLAWITALASGNSGASRTDGAPMWLHLLDAEIHVMT